MKKGLYRKNVAAVILSNNYPEAYEFFIAQRTDIENAWQFPQGGIDENESPKQALLRELKEEIGTDEVEILAEYPEWLRYDFPIGARKKMYPFIGQEQRYFLVKLKDSAIINIDTEHKEFNKYEFVYENELMNRIASFKLEVYTIALQYFKNLGFFNK